MRGILADINVEGIMAHLARIWLSATWREIWFGLGISIESFESLGLRSDSPDTVIWRTSQEEALPDSGRFIHVYLSVLVDTAVVPQLRTKKREWEACRRCARRNWRSCRAWIRSVVDLSLGDCNCL